MVRSDMGITRTGRGVALAREPYVDTSKKLGPVATTTTPAEQSCPHDCALWEKCYFRKGLHLGRVNRTLEAASAGATPLEVARAEARAIDGLSGRAPLRLHVGGDARTEAAARVVSAAAERYSDRGGQPAFTYTHAWKRVPRDAWGTVSVLASVESLAEARDARDARAAGYAPALTVDRHPADGKAWRDGELRVVPCPEQTRGVACADCRLCFDASALRLRGAVIAFAMHGSQNRKRTGPMRPVTWRGRRYRSLHAAALAAGVDPDLARVRVRLRRWSVDDALETPTSRGRPRLRVVKWEPVTVSVPWSRVDAHWRRVRRSRQ